MSLSFLCVFVYIYPLHLFVYINKGYFLPSLYIMYSLCISTISSIFFLIKEKIQDQEKITIKRPNFTMLCHRISVSDQLNYRLNGFSINFCTMLTQTEMIFNIAITGSAEAKLYWDPQFCALGPHILPTFLSTLMRCSAVRYHFSNTNILQHVM